MPDGFPRPGDVLTWHLDEVGGNTHYKVYLNPDKTNPVDHFGGHGLWPPPSTVYLEGILATAEDCPAPLILWPSFSYTAGVCIFCGYVGGQTTVVGNQVDLDVDSDNDGDMDDDDEAIEEKPFSPQRPGKWGWTNNDDSNGDTFSDNINNVIDGAGDLEDIGSLVVQNLDIAWVTNPELRLEIANPALIRVFRSKTAGATGLVGGPDLPASVDLLAELGPPVGWTLGMEGLMPGTTTLKLRLMEGGVELCSDTVRVTVIELDVAWETFVADPQPIDEPNDHPAHAGLPGGALGVKYFPGGTIPGDPWSHVIRVLVSTNPPVEGVSVFLKALDPDDPSANNNVVDDNLTGSDNRDDSHFDTLQLGSTQLVTDTNGEKGTSFRVAYQPGDNHRIAATIKQTTQGVPTLDILNDDNVPPSDTQNPPTQDQVELFIGNISPLLTVWRMLHVETDAMLRPTFAENTIIITNWNEPRFPNGELVLDINDQDGDDCFEAGYIRIQAAGFADLVSVIITFTNTNPLNDDVVHTNISQADWGARPGTGTAVMSDDDLNEANFLAGSVGSNIGVGLPPNGHVGFPVLEDDESVEGKYAVAYILPVVEPEHSTVGWPFVKNMEPEGQASWNEVLNHRTLALSTTEYWTAYVLAAFQAERAEDADCEATGTKGINTHNDGSTTPWLTWPAYLTGVCAIFKETLHDAYPASQEQRTIAHEMAHTLGVPHLGDLGVGGDGGLMDETEQGPDFLPESIQRIREYEGP